MQRFVLAFIIAVIVAVPSHATQAPIIIIHVDDDAARGGDGSGRFPFDNLPDAVAFARTLSGQVIINVAPGDYPQANTLLIDRSLVLQGSTRQVASQDRWPAGEVVPGTATRIFASNPALTYLVLFDRESFVLNDVKISGFVFEGPASGTSVELHRLQGFQVVNNVFRAPATFALVSIASSGHISGNHFSGVGTGAILDAGYPGSPSNVVFQGNRAVRTTNGGVVLNGSSTNIPELGDELNAVVQGNDLSDNTGNQGFGVRAFVIFRNPDAPGGQQSEGNVHGLVQGNRMVGNRVGIYIDAGFPYRTFNGVCDERVYTGTIELRFVGNTLSNSLLRSSLITFTRQQVALGRQPLAEYQYLHGATFTIEDHNGILLDAWIDHPERDPYLGLCPADQIHELLDNRLIYNGAILLNGRNF